MIPCIGNVQNRQIHTDRKQINGRQGLRREKGWEVLLSGYGFSSWGDKNVPESDVSGYATLGI